MNEKCAFTTYWEGKGAEKNYSTPFQLEVFSRHVTKNAAILDVGCGYGRIMDQLLRSGYRHIVGAEPSARLRERAAETGGELDIRPMSGGTLPFYDQSFDAVLLVAVLTCIPADVDLDKLVSEVRRVLKPGGVLYINDFLLNSDQRNLKRYAEFEPRHGCYGIFELEGGGVLRHFHEDRIKTLLSGFREVEYERIVYKTMNGNLSNGFYYLGSR